jgi:hypothetical protein
MEDLKANYSLVKKSSDRIMIGSEHDEDQEKLRRGCKEQLYN